MKSIDFRHMARQALERAQLQLASGNADRFRYAALELRMAMEALTYSRAQAYAAELPPEEYDIWQPKKLLDLLLDIDPLADAEGTWSYGIEEKYGVLPAKMQELGSEKKLTLATLKKHYDALGSHLHMPTIRQFSSGKGPDTAKLGKRCAEIAAFVEDVLASTVFDTALGSFSTIPCAECSAVIRKRIPPGMRRLEAQCFKCFASFALEANGQGEVIWTPHQEKISCSRPGCDTLAVIWRHEIEPGRFWHCSKCGSKNLIRLGVVLDGAPSGESQESA